jgi:hypothetical protein
MLEIHSSVSATVWRMAAIADTGSDSRNFSTSITKA